MHQVPVASGRFPEEPRDAKIWGGGRSGRLARALSRNAWTGAVAVAFTLVQLLLVVPGMGLGWDETVYVSQVSTEAPASFFSAPRARGITYLIAPVTQLTDSVTALRCYLAVLTGGALFLGLRIWRSLLPGPVVALAGALFASLWITLFYGPQVMPNLAVALSSLIATGCFLRAVRAGHADAPGVRTTAAAARAPVPALVGLGCAVAVAALMRPSDAVWLVLPLLVAALAVRAWRSPLVVLVLLAGAVAGAGQWVVEAYAAYGGLITRLHRSSEIQGGMGWHLAFGYQLRALEGRSLCRPCDMPWRRPSAALWWFALPVLVLGGVLAAVRTRLRAVVLLPALTGLSLAVPYLLMIDYAAPRFLLPTYALLFLPVALGLIRLVAAVRPALRAQAATVVALVLVVHVGSQYATLHGIVDRSRATRDSIGFVAAELNRQGVRPPCTVTGLEAVRIAFRAGCASRQIGGHDSSLSSTDLLRLAEHRPVALLLEQGRPVPAYTRGWRPEPARHLPGLREFRMYVSPPPGG
ncbi:hypothetical protein [Streptomyces sp. 150FB]|uniref:hypothetical protein n=1 Tax=Streptomyces sp. 150FB TaxID=1576605 RepID=UPI00099CC287|nr:hypothetical protein [Streptomyces sp. 150FB]